MQDEFDSSNDCNAAVITCNLRVDLNRPSWRNVYAGRRNGRVKGVIAMRRVVAFYAKHFATTFVFFSSSFFSLFLLFWQKTAGLKCLAYLKINARLWDRSSGTISVKFVHRAHYVCTSLFVAQRSEGQLSGIFVSSSINIDNYSAILIMTPVIFFVLEPRLCERLKASRHDCPGT